MSLQEIIKGVKTAVDLSSAICPAIILGNPCDRTEPLGDHLALAWQYILTLPIVRLFIFLSYIFISTPLIFNAANRARKTPDTVG